MAQHEVNLPSGLWMFLCSFPYWFYFPEVKDSKPTYVLRWLTPFNVIVTLFHCGWNAQCQLLRRGNILFWLMVAEASVPWSSLGSTFQGLEWGRTSWWHDEHVARDILALWCTGSRKKETGRDQDLMPSRASPEWPTFFQIFPKEYHQVRIKRLTDEPVGWGDIQIQYLNTSYSNPKWVSIIQ